MPKNVLIRATIAQAAKTITRPIRAEVIWALAVSVWALSPPEAIHLIPPMTKMKKKIIAATTTVNLMKAATISGIVKSPKGAKALPLGGLRSIVSASRFFI